MFHHKVLIGFSAAGMCVAGIIGEWLDDANNISKLGLCAFMAFCLIVLCLAVIALCKFIIKTLIPLKEAIATLASNVETNNKIMVEVKDVVRDCHSRSQN